MSRSAVIIFLIFSLVATNSFWLYHVADAGLTATYQDVARQDLEGALDQVLSVVPVACSANKDKIIQAAMSESSRVEPFIKDGYVWVENIGLAFGPTGQLVQVVKSWQ